MRDAVDELQYATGPVTSYWGAQRAKDGHPAPFHVSLAEIGNEDFFDASGSYQQRPDLLIAVEEELERGDACAADCAVARRVARVRR